MIDPSYAHLGAAIRRRRLEVGMTQTALATHLGLSRSSVTNIECGRQPMLVHQLLHAARALDLDLGELLPGLQAIQPAAERTAADMYERMVARLRIAHGGKS